MSTVKIRMLGVESQHPDYLYHNGKVVHAGTSLWDLQTQRRVTVVDITEIKNGASSDWS